MGSRSGHTFSSVTVWADKAEDPLINPIDPTYGDEFDAGTLDGAWTTLNIAQTPGNVAAISPYSSAGLSIEFDAQGDAIFRPAPSGDWELVCGFKAVDTIATMTGIASVDAAGTGVAFSPYDAANCYMWAITTYNYTASGPSISGSPVVNQRYWIALKKVGTAYTGRYSVDGQNWTGYTTSQAGSNTPDRVGILRAFTGASSTFNIYRFNYYPSPTFYIP